MEKLGNAVVFVIVYILFMVPTYFLPWLGSNSALLNTAGVASGVGIHPLFWLHLGALAVLVVVTWFRASLVNKQWIVVFPILATVFDLVPGLNMIPLVPTVMHLLAIILGVAGASAVSGTRHVPS